MWHHRLDLADVGPRDSLARRPTVFLLTNAIWQPPRCRVAHAKLVESNESSVRDVMPLHLQVLSEIPDSWTPAGILPGVDK